MHPFTQKILSVFKSHANAENAIPMKQYMKDIDEFYGIKSPDRRELFREVLASFPKDIINDYEIITTELFKHGKREAHYTAVDFLSKTKKAWNIDTIKLLEYLILQKSWWDTVDALAPLIGEYFKKYPEKKSSYIKKWMASDSMWLQRVCLIFQKGYKHDTDQELLFSLCLQLADSKEFFIRKGMGWALREYASVNPEAVMTFVTTHSLSPLTTREAIRKII